jgi:hypothetical protein
VRRAEKGSSVGEVWLDPEGASGSIRKGRRARCLLGFAAFSGPVAGMMPYALLLIEQDQNDIAPSGAVHLIV